MASPWKKTERNNLREPVGKNCRNHTGQPELKTDTFQGISAEDKIRLNMKVTFCVPENIIVIIIFCVFLLN